MAGRLVFLSYSRADSVAATTVEADLVAAGYDVWRDQRVSGGQDWWNSILRRIRDCDVFVSVVSPESVRSLPCARELGYAVRLRKPVLPVRVGEPLPAGTLPAELAARQMIDHADDKASALRLFRALTDLPPAPALPDPLPDPPAAPLSYTTELASLVYSPQELTTDELALLVSRLGAGVDDPAVAQDCQSLLAELQTRRDLPGDTRRQVTALLERPAGIPAVRARAAAPRVVGAGTGAVGAPGPGGLRLPRHPVLSPLVCAAWLLWVAYFLLGRQGDQYLSLGFAAFAMATPVVAGVEWARLRTHSLWLLCVAAHSVVVVPVLVKEMDSDQTVMTRGVFVAFSLALLAVAVRVIRAPGTASTASDGL